MIHDNLLVVTVSSLPAYMKQLGLRYRQSETAKLSETTKQIIMLHKTHDFGTFLVSLLWINVLLWISIFLCDKLIILTIWYMQHNVRMYIEFGCDTNPNFGFRLLMLDVFWCQLKFTYFFCINMKTDFP